MDAGPVLTSVISGAAAGLMGAPHCVGMCGGFVAAAGRGRAGGAWLWHAGRALTYAALGTAAGAMGAAGAGLGSGAAGGGVWAARAVLLIGLAMLVWFAARLAGFERAGVHWRLPALERAGAWLARGRTWPMRLGFGVLVGLMPCGLIYAALALAVTAGGPVAGGLSMLAFGIATLPALEGAARGLRLLAARSVWVRRGVAAGVLAMGLASTAARWPAGEQAAGAAPSCHAQ